MRLLIVEDEHFVRERLQMGIPWSEHGIEVVGAVANGRLALDLMTKEHVDLVLTDIRMPDMNGLELAREIYQNYPFIKLIVLTGYDDFEYAQESIDYQVFKYLVKPVANEQLLEVVLHLKKLHEQQLWEKHELKLLEQRWREHLPHLQTMMYRNWLNGRYAQWELEKRSDDLNLSLHQGKVWPLVFDMDPIPEHNERFMEQDRALVQFSLLTLTKDVFSELHSVIMQDDDGMTAVLLFEPEMKSEEAGSWQSQVHQHIQTLLAAVKDCLKLTASVGIGPLMEARLLPHAYKQSKLALQERIVLGNETIMQYRDHISMSTAWMLIQDIEKDLEMAIETGNETRIVQLTENMIEAQFAHGISITEAKEVILRMVCFFSRIIHGHGWTISSALGDEYIRFEQFHTLLTRNQVLEWLQTIAISTCRTISARRWSGTQRMVREIERFIGEHIHDEELSLYMVADKLYINYSYLSRTFKKIVGESFSEYVLRLRMERAKELLTGGQMVYAAAALVGYRHVNYFSKVFMKYWGVKPSEIKQ